MKQEFVDTSVGGTDDICSGCFFYIQYQWNDIVVIGRLTNSFSNSTSPSMSLYKGLTKKRTRGTGA